VTVRLGWLRARACADAASLLPHPLGLGVTYAQGTADRPGLVPQALEHIFRQLGAPGACSSGDAGGGGVAVARVVVSAYEVCRDPAPEQGPPP
jgi:hypothetical protein